MNEREREKINEEKRYNEWDRKRWVRKKNIMNERERDNEKERMR